MMKFFAALVPYIAVLLGMKLLHSAWITILLYHAGILLFLFLRKPSNGWKTMWGGWKNPLFFPAIGTCALAVAVPGLRGAGRQFHFLALGGGEVRGIRPADFDARRC